MATAKIMLQATMGLAKAHAQGIIHRDIKPANIYLTRREDGDIIAKLLDFGIAKVRMEALADQGSQGLTATGSVLGTPLYMSPEQARGLPTVDARSDVWSLGIVMYEILSGNIPYENARTLGDLMVAIITADLPLLQDRAPWVPPELAEIAHRAMSRDPDKRYANAGEMRDALLTLLPDGPRIRSEQLVAVAPSERAIVQPRLAITDGMLKAVARTGLSMTKTPPEQKAAPAPAKTGSGAILGATALGVVMLGGVAFGAWSFLKGGPPQESPVSPTQPAATVAPAPTAAAPSAASEGDTKTFSLVILPSDVTVFVDDKPVRVQNESVRITGAPGSTKTVRLQKDTATVERVVAITNDGLVPPKVELTVAQPAPPPGAPRPVSAGRAPPPQSPKKPAGAAAGEEKPKKSDHLITDTSEFQ
jgi:serine/threonine-protein kinase